MPCFSLPVNKHMKYKILLTFQIYRRRLKLRYPNVELMYIKRGYIGILNKNFSLLSEVIFGFIHLISYSLF